MEMWNDCTRLTRECNELKVENQILNDWVRRLEYRIQQLEESPMTTKQLATILLLLCSIFMITANLNRGFADEGRRGVRSEAAIAEETRGDGGGSSD